MNSATTYGVIIAGLITFAGIVYTQRTVKQLAKQNAAREDSNRGRSDDVERDRIEADAYERARDSYEAGIRDMVAQGKRRDEAHAEELRYLNGRLSERNKRILELEDQLAETRKQVHQIRAASEEMSSRLDAAERAIARNTRLAAQANARVDARVDVAEERADTSERRADVSEVRADDAETQADTDRKDAST